MNEKRILEIFGNIREEYIYEANPWKRKKHRFRINSFAAAACICFLFVSILIMSYFVLNPEKKKYYTTDMDEVLSVYEGELLAENIPFDNANDTEILLCYTGDDLPVSSREWKTLTVSANYEDYNMTLNCGFNGEKFAVNSEDVIDEIQYGDMEIKIYPAENTSDFENAYHAVFEYKNVCYELKTYSNDKECIYEILHVVLGESNSDGEHDFTDVLGFTDYYVTVDQNMPGFMIEKFYINENGNEKCIAVVFGYAVPGPEAYSKDLDGDGINELICNCIYGTGARRVYIYRNHNGVIERGSLSYDLWDERTFPGITNQGASYIAEQYFEEENIFEISYPVEDGAECIVLEDLEWFVFEEFIDEY